MRNFICGKLTSRKEDVFDIDPAVFSHLVKVSLAHRLNVVFGANITQRIIYEMFDMPNDGESNAVAFMITSSPIADTSDALLPLEADEEFDEKIRELVAAIRTFFAAAATSGLFSEALRVFSEAGGTSGAYPTVRTDLAGMVDACVKHFVRDGFEFPNLHVVVAMQ